MAFCSFSKDCDDNSYVTVENRFITNYLPEADGFAVKVYLYGLYVCKSAVSDFSLTAMAEVLKTDEEKIVEAFAFWEDYDWVQIISKNPFAVQYLPVKAAIGRPKKVRYEKYTDFNKELERKMQKVGKPINAGEFIKYMKFLEETAMQPQALLLIAEYCINKQGNAVSPSYIFNKAKKLIAGGATTYEQVERELSSYNANEVHVVAILSALGLTSTNSYPRTPDESEYSLYRKWTETLEFDKAAIVAAARQMKRGTMRGLDGVLEDLYEQGVKEAKAVTEFLTNREMMASLTFRIGRKLGLKVSNPATYIEEYVSKWLGYGFEDSTLLDVALFCLKNEKGSFEDMHTLLVSLVETGRVDKDAVKAYIKERNDDAKLFVKIQEICGVMRKNASHLTLIRSWKENGFSVDMILEAAKRSATSSNPMPYMNKILSDWQQEKVFFVKDIPQTAGAGTSSSAKSGNFISPTVAAANAKADRDRYYALLREQAQKRADANMAKANKNQRFSTISKQLSSMEFSLAKAEMFEPHKLPALLQQQKDLQTERSSLLKEMGIAEKDLLPQFTCQKCQDTGFLKNGQACDCYKG